MATTTQLNKQSYALIAITCLCISPFVTALESDASAPIQIQSDTVSVNNQTQQATYSGNVSITQGSIKINGQKIVIKANKGRLHSADIYGTQAKPASFEQTTEKGERIKGKALEIQLNQTDNLLTLTKNAELHDGKNTLTGGAIVYNSKRQTISAKGGKKNRIKMTFLPPESASDN